MAVTKIRGNTQIIAGTITNAEINSAAAIATSKLADGAEFLKRDGSVLLTGDLNANNNKIIGLASPVADTDAATKAYADSIASGLDVKASVRVATTGDIVLSGEQTIDAIAVVSGDRVLVKNQVTASQNGIYVVAIGAWTRSLDADTSAEVTSGMFTFVEQGTVNISSGWILTTPNPITLDTTALTFTQFSGAGQVVAGNGLTKTGNTLDVGAGDGIQADADSVTVKLDGLTLTKSVLGLKVSTNAIDETHLTATVAGNGLGGGNGTPLSVNAGEGIEVSTDTVAVKIDGTTLARSGVGLKVADSGITAVQLNTLVAGNGLTGGGGVALAVGAGDGIDVAVDSVTVKLDGTTIAKSSVGIKVNTAGITANEIAADAVTAEKINLDVAGDGLAQEVTGALKVNVGDGIELLADAVTVKLDGTSLSKSASGLKADASIVQYVANYVTREIPAGLIDGINAVFTLANTPVVGTEMIFLNGILQDVGVGNDYTIVGATITFASAPVVGDKIRVTYLK